MRNACPTCQTVYAVTPADVGRRIVCRRCGATLVIDADGFRLETTTPDTPPPPQPEPLPKLSRRRDDDRPPLGADLFAKFKKLVDVPTLVFALGVFFTLWFLFMPVIGAANVGRAKAVIDGEQMEHTQRLKRLREKPTNADAVTKAEEEWQKRREKLEQDEKAAAVAHTASLYWDRYGLLFGLTLTAFGAIGLFGANQPTTKRIVGAVVVCAVLVLLLVGFISGASSLTGR